MASAYAKNLGISPENQPQDWQELDREVETSEQRLDKAFSLLEYKVQNLVSRQHQELTQLHLRLQEAQAMAEEISDDLFFQADIEKEKSTIRAELDAVNAREYEIRTNAHGLIKSLEKNIRNIKVVLRAA